MIIHIRQVCTKNRKKNLMSFIHSDVTAAAAAVYLFSAFSEILVIHLFLGYLVGCYSTSV